MRLTEDVMTAIHNQDIISRPAYSIEKPLEADNQAAFFIKKRNTAMR
jgi:hypothetical protein